MRQGIIDIHARRISDHNQCLILVITTATMVMALGTITNNRILSAAPRQLLTFCSLRIRISILASNSNTYTPHRFPPQLHSHIVLIYFRPRARLPIPTCHSRHPTTSVPSHLVWAISVEPHQVQGLIAEPSCGVLWGRREHLQLLGG
jgi:hypothetical protein